MKKITILTIICMTLLTASAYAATNYKCVCEGRKGSSQCGNGYLGAQKGKTVTKDRASVRMCLPDNDYFTLLVKGKVYSEKSGWECSKQ
jgi:hypothetical protein